jgi:hypothetical protein
VKWLPVTGGKQREHLFNLNDLLGGAAHKPQQGLAKGLAQDGQAWEGGKAGREMRVAAPRQAIGIGGRTG